MKFIKNDSLNPYFNLALEEYCLKNLKSNEDYVILWRDEPSVIVGKNQNAIEEINSDFINHNKINVVRRITGGGAVYHDEGNLNFTFVTTVDKLAAIDFKKYTIPIINALGKFGVEAELSGRNDITIQDKKISGNAQYIHKGRLLHHGTLLFNSELDILGKALNVKKDKIQSKGIKSVRSRVTNINEYLTSEISIDEFKNLILKYLFEFQGTSPEEYCLSNEDMNNINNLIKDKYSTWEWNYGKSPSFNFKNRRRFTGGSIEVFLDIKKGIVNECKIYGDFLAVYNIQDIEQKIKGSRYVKEDVKMLLEKFNIQKYFGAISVEEILECFFD